MKNKNIRDLEASRLKKNIGEKIKFFRKRKGLSQSELAELVNIEMKSLSRIESGHNYPQCENLIAIAKALDVAPWQFYHCDDVKNINKMKDDIINSINLDSNYVVSLYQYLQFKKANQ